MTFFSTCSPSSSLSTLTLENTRPGSPRRPLLEPGADHPRQQGTKGFGHPLPSALRRQGRGQGQQQGAQVQLRAASSPGACLVGARLKFCTRLPLTSLLLTPSLSLSLFHSACMPLRPTSEHPREPAIVRHLPHRRRTALPPSGRWSRCHLAHRSSSLHHW